MIESLSNDIIFDVKQLAVYLGVSLKWIYERTCRKTIPHHKIGGSVRFRKSEIDKWFEDQKVPVIE